MKLVINTILVKFCLIAVISCTSILPTQMTPPLSALNMDGITKENISIGYIPPSVNEEVTLKKKGYYYYAFSTTVKLSPYRDSTRIFKRVLNNIFTKVVRVKNVKSPFADNEQIKYVVSIKNIKTVTDDPTFDFGLFVHGNDYSQNYAIAFTCKIVNRANKVVWEKEIIGKGHATENEIRNEAGGNSLAPTRALLAGFQKLQDELNEAELKK